MKNVMLHIFGLIRLRLTLCLGYSGTIEQKYKVKKIVANFS